MPRPTVHCTCVYMCTVISVGASMQSEHASMQALAVTGIGSNDGKRQGVPYAYLFSTSYSSCPRVLGSAESHASPIQPAYTSAYLQLQHHLHL